MPIDFSRLPPDRRAEAEAMHARMMAALPYERMAIVGRTAAAEIEWLKGLGKGYPVVVGGDDALEEIAEQYSLEDPALFLGADSGAKPRAPGAILDDASSINFPDDLAQWEGASKPDELTAPVGDWPDDVPAADPGDGLPSVVYDFRTSQPFERVHVLFIPTENSWEVPAFLRWGDWNACPPPEYHVAALRRWHEAYGAELIGIGRDLMDVRVSRPPRDRDAALAVAREIYAYCPDDVDQGSGTLAALAVQMVMQHWWSFWWD